MGTRGYFPFHYRFEAGLTWCLRFAAVRPAGLLALL